MISIEISKDVKSIDDMVDLLGDIAYEIKNKGKTFVSGKWSMSGDYEEDCVMCSGSGETTDNELNLVSCQNCKGDGKVSVSV